MTPIRINKRGPKPGARKVAVSVGNALKAWGPEMPEWVSTLAAACDAPGSSQARIGKRIGYTGSTVNQVLKNNYKGDLNAIEEAVKGGLMDVTIDCPVAGDIPLNVCVGNRRRTRKIGTANPLRVKFHIHCPKCRHNAGSATGNVR